MGIVHGVPEGSGKGIRTGSGQVHDRYVQHVVLRWMKYMDEILNNSILAQ